MKLFFRFLLLIAICLPGLFEPAAGLAQPSPLTAEVSSGQLSVDELVTLTVTVTTEELVFADPTIPPLTGFTVYQQSRESSVVDVAGQTGVQLTYRLKLKPNHPGSYIIPPISITLGGQFYSTDPIPVEVDIGSGAPTYTPTAQPTERDYFVEADVDNPTPYLGQQLTYHFRLFKPKSSFSVLRYGLPEFNGFWHKHDPSQISYTAERNSRELLVLEDQVILFPLLPGETLIEAPTFKSAAGLAGLSEGPLAEPVLVTVKPLPEPRPEKFNGAVGDYALDVTLNKRQTLVNEAITLLVTVSGRGNVDTLPPPVWPNLPNWRAIDQQPGGESRVVDGVAQGQRTFRRVLIPGLAGEFTLPPIDYVYFEPDGETYHTLSSEPFPVLVLPGPAGDLMSPAVAESNRQAVEQVGVDIRHIKPAPARLAAVSRSLTRQLSFWLLWLLPIAALGLVLIWQQRQHWQQHHRAGWQRRGALRQARRSLAQAKAAQADPYATVERVLAAYLAYKLGRPVAGLTQAALRQELAVRGLDHPLQMRVLNCLTHSQSARFGQVGEINSDEAFLAETEALLVDLDAAFESILQGYEIKSEKDTLT